MSHVMNLIVEISDGSGAVRDAVTIVVYLPLWAAEWRQTYVCRNSKYDELSKRLTATLNQMEQNCTEYREYSQRACKSKHRKRGMRKKKKKAPWEGIEPPTSSDLE